MQQHALTSQMQLNNIESIMVNDLEDARHTDYPSYYFDRVNLLGNYK